MILHSASCLEGPITCQRAWWQQEDLEPDARRDRGDNDMEVRAELVARVRQAIADGTYDTPEKWEIALSRLIEDLS